MAGYDTRRKGAIPMTPEQKAAIEAARRRVAGGMTEAQAAAIAAATERARLVELALPSQPSQTQTDSPFQVGAGRLAAERDRVAAMGPDERAEYDALIAEIGQRRRQSGVSRLGAATQGAIDTVTFGAADELGAAMVAPFVGGTYADVRDAARQGSADAFSARPGYYIGGSVAGGLAVPGAGAGRAISAAPTVGRAALAGAGIGAATGAATGFGMGEGGLANRLASAGQSAVIGAGLGGVVGAAGNKLERAVQAFRQRRALMGSAPSEAELQTAAGEIFRRADDVSNLPRSALTSAFPGMQEDAMRAGMDEILTPSAARVVGRMEDAATSPSPNISFRELDILRRQSGIPASDAANPAQAAIGSQLRDSLDDVLNSADSGIAREVADARDMWGRLRRSEVIQEAIEKASNQASGFENGIRVQLRAILNNPKRMRGFSSTERQAMRDIVQGTTFGNIMRKVGALGPGIAQQRNGLSMGLGAGAGAVVAGPVGAVAAPVVGGIAQRLAERSTERGAAALAALARSGGRVPAVSPSVIPRVATSSAMGQTGVAANAFADRTRR